MNKRNTQSSRFLSLVLRHKPEEIGLDLDANGWANIDELLGKFQKAGKPISRDTLNRIVADNDKQRFVFNPDSTLIRANQGHSVQVQLDYENSEPPEILYHGTAEGHLKSILKMGIKKQKRHQVNLSQDKVTAHQVGRRHGLPVILEVQAQAMYADGYVFQLSLNGVWLVNEVPPSYLKLI